MFLSHRWNFLHAYLHTYNFILSGLTNCWLYSANKSITVEAKTITTWKSISTLHPSWEALTSFNLHASLNFIPMLMLWYLMPNEWTFWDKQRYFCNKMQNRRHFTWHLYPLIGKMSPGLESSLCACKDILVLIHFRIDMKTHTHSLFCLVCQESSKPINVDRVNAEGRLVKHWW